MPGHDREPVKAWLMDMDGVLVHEEQAIPGADLFLSRLRERGGAGESGLQERAAVELERGVAHAPRGW